MRALLTVFWFLCAVSMNKRVMLGGMVPCLGMRGFCPVWWPFFVECYRAV